MAAAVALSSCGGSEASGGGLRRLMVRHGKRLRSSCVDVCYAPQAADPDYTLTKVPWPCIRAPVAD